MGAPLITRVKLKVRKLRRDLDPTEREWRRVWPLIDSVEGFFNEDHAKWLFKAARALPDGSNIVEIGSFKGRSTCCLALSCRKTKKRVFAVDPFDGGPDLPRCDSFQEFSQNIERCGLSEHVQSFVAFGGEVAKTWRRPIHF